MSGREAPAYAVVIPTIGRPELAGCLLALDASAGPAPSAVVVVDDRPAPAGPLPLPVLPRLGGVLRRAATGGAGPAAARNAGWRAAPVVPWIVFLDDDVRVGRSWCADLAADLAAAEPPAADPAAEPPAAGPGFAYPGAADREKNAVADPQVADPQVADPRVADPQPAGPVVGGVQGRLEVPLPTGRRPTDRERDTAALAGAAWVTADMAYRRDVLVETGGFDPRFRRAFREDADLALRVLDQGRTLVRGCRVTTHPVRRESAWASVRAQRGNADDVLMGRLHGRDWHRRARAPIGRLPGHLLVTGLGAGALGAAAARRPRAAGALLAAWAAGTAEFAVARLRHGPGTPAEVATVALTSVAIPPVATAHRMLGTVRHRRVRPYGAVPRAVLFDRDGTLVHDVPYNADPALVRPVPDAAAALARLRAAGLATGVVTNQSGVARGLIGADDLARVNARVEELLGTFGTWAVCVHGEGDGCGCRKPAPGLVLAAAAALGLGPEACVVVGDTGADVAAARAAGARSVLVPNAATRPAELAGARVAGGLTEAVDMILRGLR